MNRFGVDIGEGRAVVPSNYTLRYASSGNFCCPRNWLLQGTNDPNSFKVSDYSSPSLRDMKPGKSSKDPRTEKDGKWITLIVHEGDNSLDSDYATHTWKIPERKGWNWARFSSEVFQGHLDIFELFNLTKTN